ncbi:MAG: TRAP transporter permease [Alphaproteobacteria bacterium]|nr:TRAP transporter permease [Alphaproteobacteria bacterium]
MSSVKGTEPSDGTAASAVDLDELVAASDTGARAPTGTVGKALFGVALVWSLFQLWIASPLPFMAGFGVFNDTEARSIHLAFAIFLAFTAYPAFASSPRDHVPIQDWVFAVVGAFAAAYLYLFYVSISSRPGAPISQDYVVAVVGMILLLEATRRALGPPLMIIAMVFLVYTFFGQYMPSIIAHKGNTLGEVVNHHWITTEGVFGIALGVSTSFVFLFVLFGSLLDKGGAGNYFIQVAFSLMGHMKGGPAKAAVVSSAMTGLISGSSIANVVTTGTFTIPLMKRVGFSSEKAGAVEVASSVNGQIMPPVMGAAAFLMVEYVGIPYFEVVKHAFLPALISYIALVYIVHLEALKAGMEGLPRAYEPGPLMQRLIMFAFGVLVLCAISFAVYYGIGWIRPAFGEAASWIIAVLLVVVYVALCAFGARYPALKMDDPNKPVAALPLPGPTIKAGLHFILPVVVLVWALMVERLSPGLSAFWGAVFMIFILLTQRPLFAFFRKVGDVGEEIKAGFTDLLDGLVAGARNMIGIGIATATAGIIVGAVSQTGVGSALAEVVEVLSGGNILAILFLTAILSLILGMGLPTTANYIVVSALLAPVIVTLGQQNGLIVPLIAVHLFVFYFGIMADVTPPVGLASFAAAAVSGGDPIKTGFVAFFYSLRTAALPFLFIFNTELLLINVGWVEGIFVFITATIAMLVFAAATQGWFFDRLKIWEVPLLLLIAFSIFRPGFWMDRIVSPFNDVAPSEIAAAAEATPAGTELRLRVAGLDQFGSPIEFVAPIQMSEGATGEEKLTAAGITLREDGDKVLIDDVAFDSAAQKAGLDWDQEILQVRQPADQPSKYWIFIPVFLILAAVVWLQRRRTGGTGSATAEATA